MPNQEPYGQPRRRSSAESRFGSVDTTAIDQGEQLFDEVLTGMATVNRMSMRRRARNVEQRFIDRSISSLEDALKSPQGQDPAYLNQLIDKTQLKLSKFGGEESRKVGADIQRLRKTPKVDTNLTADEAYLRHQIDYDTYKKMKQAGKNQGSRLLRSEKVTIDGTTKMLDYYGYTDEDGREVITEKKYSDFTKGSGGAVNFFGQGGGGKRKVNIPFVNATGGAKGNTVRIERKTMDLTHDELVNTIDTELERVDSEAQQFQPAKGGGEYTAEKKSFLGIDALASDVMANYKSWENFKQGKARVDELDPAIQNYAIAWNELKNQQNQLDKGQGKVKESAVKKSKGGRGKGF